MSKFDDPFSQPGPTQEEMWQGEPFGHARPNPKVKHPPPTPYSCHECGKKLLSRRGYATHLAYSHEWEWVGAVEYVNALTGPDHLIEIGGRL